MDGAAAARGRAREAAAAREVAAAARRRRARQAMATAVRTLREGAVGRRLSTAADAWRRSAVPVPAPSSEVGRLAALGGALRRWATNCAGELGDWRRKERWLRAPWLRPLRLAGRCACGAPPPPPPTRPAAHAGTGGGAVVAAARGRGDAHLARIRRAPRARVARRRRASPPTRRLALDGWRDALGRRSDALALLGRAAARSATAGSASLSTWQRRRVREHVAADGCAPPPRAPALSCARWRFPRQQRGRAAVCARRSPPMRRRVVGPAFLRLRLGAAAAAAAAALARSVDAVRKPAVRPSCARRSRLCGAAAPRAAARAVVHRWRRRRLAEASFAWRRWWHATSAMSRLALFARQHSSYQLLRFMKDCVAPPPRGRRTRRTAAAAAPASDRAALQKAIARLHLHRSAVHHASTVAACHVARAFGAWRSSAAVRSDRLALLSRARALGRRLHRRRVAGGEPRHGRARAATAAAAALNAWRQQGLRGRRRCLSAVAAARPRRRTIASLLARTAATASRCEGGRRRRRSCPAPRRGGRSRHARARSLRRAFSSWAPLAPVGRQRKLLRQAALSLLGMRAGAALRRWLEAATARRHASSPSASRSASGPAARSGRRSSAGVRWWPAGGATRRRFDGPSRRSSTARAAVPSSAGAPFWCGAACRATSYRRRSPLARRRRLDARLCALRYHAQTSSAAAITVRRWRFAALSFAVREWREAAERRGALAATLGDAVLRWRLANVGRLLRSWRRRRRCVCGCKCSSRRLGERETIACTRHLGRALQRAVDGGAGPTGA